MERKAKFTAEDKLDVPVLKEKEAHTTNAVFLQKYRHDKGRCPDVP